MDHRFYRSKFAQHLHLAPPNFLGQIKYVVMSQEHYHYLRECELEAALAESKADLTSGRFVRETVAQHLKRLKQLHKSVK